MKVGVIEGSMGLGSQVLGLTCRIYELDPSLPERSFVGKSHVIKSKM